MKAKNDSEAKVWLITGCSSGFGREIALSALAAGEKVGVSARNIRSISDICDRYPKTAMPITLDVTQEKERKSAISDVKNNFGRIDVLVNNAGYGYLSAIEEGEDIEVFKLFETNFFGALSLTKMILPHMRAQKSGRIINNSSQAGLMANPGTGYYSATKYALEGLMEALAKEVAQFNIFVTSIEPGAFRTDWSGRSMRRSNIEILDYADSVKNRLDMISDIDGKQPGDPERAAKIIFDLSRHPNPPTQLLLGAGVLASYREKLDEMKTSLKQWEEVTLSADFPKT